MTDREYLKQIGAKIRAARRRNGLSVKTMAKKYGLDFGYISRLENGQFDVKILTLKRFAEMLNTDLSEFL